MGHRGILKIYLAPKLDGAEVLAFRSAVAGFGAVILHTLWPAG